MSRRILILQGHPDPGKERLCHALADAYATGARDAGHEVREITIGDLDVPILRTAADFEAGAPPETVQRAQQDIARANHLVLIYPLWLGTMPGLLKVFIEQVFRPGFAFERTEDSWPRKGLTNRSARIMVTMGMPAFVYRLFYLSHSLKSLERNILKFVGISPVRTTVIGMIGAINDAKYARLAGKMRKLGASGI